MEIEPSHTVKSKQNQSNDSTKTGHLPEAKKENKLTDVSA